MLSRHSLPFVKFLPAFDVAQKRLGPTRLGVMAADKLFDVKAAARSITANDKDTHSPQNVVVVKNDFRESEWLTATLVIHQKWDVRIRILLNGN
jgi:hypothetical protein